MLKKNPTDPSAIRRAKTSDRGKAVHLIYEGKTLVWRGKTSDKNAAMIETLHQICIAQQEQINTLTKTVSLLSESLKALEQVAVTELPDDAITGVTE